jgi:hypothetical protein
VQGSTEITLWFRVAKQRNQTNSNLLGMGLALLLPRCIQSLVGRAPGPVGLALESRGICSGQASGPNIFFRVGPPVKSQAPSFKLDRVQALGYYKIMKGINYVNKRS